MNRQKVTVRDFKPPDWGLGNTGIFLEVRIGSHFLGKLTLSNAKIEWIEPNCSNGKRITWQELRDFILEKGRPS